MSSPAVTESAPVVPDQQAETPTAAAAAAQAFTPRPSRPHIFGVYGAAWAQRPPVAARPRPVNPWLGL